MRNADGGPPVSFDNVAVSPFDMAASDLPETVMVADFTGDGLDDVLYRVHYGAGYQPIYLHRAHLNADGGLFFGPEILVNQPGTHFSVVDLRRSRPADVDGDGRLELLAALDPDLGNGSVYPDPGYIVFSWNDTLSKFEIPSGADFLQGDPDLDIVQLADANGDGLLDIFREKPDSSQVSGATDFGKWLLALNDQGTFPEFKNTGLLSVQGGLARAMDIDGDGRGDLLPIDWDTVLEGTADDPVLPGFTTVLGLDDSGNMGLNPLWRLQSFNRLELLDLNGDGLRDALYPFGADTMVRWNLGNGFGPLVSLPSAIVPPPSSEFYPDIGLRAADFDGDGVDDIVTFANNDAPTFEEVRLHRLRNGEIQGELLGHPGTAPLQHNVPDENGDEQTVQDGWPYCKLGDFNGDGLSDILHMYIEWTTDEYGAAHASFQLRALIQQPASSDLLFEVSDEDAPHAIESVFYDRTRTAGASCAWPQRCLRQGIPVVALTVTASGGDLSTFRYKNYSYEDPRMDLLGRGFLGFGRVSVFDQQLRTQTITTYDHATWDPELKLYPFAGLPKEVTHIAPIFDTPSDDTEMPALPDGPLFARRTNVVNVHELVPTNPGAATFVVHSTASTTIETEVEVLSIEGTNVELALPSIDGDWRRFDAYTLYDGFDNPTDLISMTKDGTFRYALWQYENRVDDWLLGLPVRLEVTAGMLYGQGETRTVSYSHDEMGLSATTTLEPDHPELARTVRFLRNEYGLPHRIEVSAQGVTTRTASFAYDPYEHMFPRLTWNQYGHYTQYVHHPGFGVMVATSDPNEVVTTYSYDGFARVRRVVPEGATAFSAFYASAKCLTQAAAQKGTCTRVAYDDGTEHVEYADEIGRIWEVGDTGFDGDLVFRRQRCNVFGQPVRLTRPFKLYEAAPTVVTFDTLGRSRQVQQPDLSTAYFDHTMFSILRTDANGHTRKLVRDNDGRVVESHDALGNTARYTYAPFDLVESVEDPLGNTTTMEYDKLGRRTRLDDPDQGTTQFEYNGFGELTKSTHLADVALGTADLVTELQYDDLGRLRFRSDTAGDPATTQTTEYRYDWALHGRGKLYSTISPDDIQTVHTYDEYSRPKVTEWKIDGVSYQFERSYHPSYGRLESLQYPSAASYSFGLEYEHNGAGWLASVRRLSSPASAPPVWQVEERNADGMLTRATFGAPQISETRTYGALTGRLHTIQVKDGGLVDLTYLHDLTGNVTYRRDDVEHRTESFIYDDADRLQDWILKYPGDGGVLDQHAVHYDYDDLGNLAFTFVNGAPAETHVMDPTRPHRLASIDFWKSGEHREYFHDARGRQDQDSTGRQIEYTPFDLPKYISDGGKEADFLYDAFQARAKKTTVDGNGVTTTVTLAGLYERRQRTEGSTVTIQHVYYVPGEDGPVAQVLYDETSQQETTAYLARDGLGSVSVVFDNNGDELERLYHEPFGRRTEISGDLLPSFTSAANVSLGFTGHRHDDDFGMIDMNGRVYDPVQKRFLSPDPLVPNPLNSQSYNRYSYVLNNPLTYTDPSGFQETRPLPTIAQGIMLLVSKIQELFSTPAKPPEAPTPPPVAKPQGQSTSPQPSQPTGGSSDGRGEDKPKAPQNKPDKDTPPDPGVVQHPVVQAGGGAFVGAGLGAVPGGAVVDIVGQKAGVIAPGQGPAARSKAAAQVLIGVVQIGLGFYLGGLGGGASASGVGVIVGAPVLAVAGVLVTNGTASVLAGAHNLDQALSTGGGSGGDGVGSAEPAEVPRPEEKYLGSGKHGIEWKEGPALAKSTGKSQGQWGSRADLDFAASKAATLKPRESNWFKLPAGHSSVVHRADGTTVPATRIWIRNNGTGTFHGYPAE